MSTDARLSTGLPNHPKTKKLIRRLGPGAAWSLVCLFLWARNNRPDGDLSGMTAEDIELACDWIGENDALVRELVAVGFLDGQEGSYMLHDWSDHQPWAVGSEARSDRAKWSALCRRHGREEASRMMPEYAAKLAKTANHSANSTESSANSSDIADDSSAISQKSPAPSPSPSPSPSPKATTSSLRSDSSSAPPADPPDGLKLVSPNPESKAERLAAVTKDAIETFNAASFTKAHGGAVPNVSPTVGVDKRRQQVARCVKTAREICREQFGQPVVTREFWEAYWTEVAADDFLSGRQAGGPGHENWRPDFEYLTRPATMLKVYERAAAA